MSLNGVEHTDSILESELWIHDVAMSQEGLDRFSGSTSQG